MGVAAGTPSCRNTSRQLRERLQQSLVVRVGRGVRVIFSGEGGRVVRGGIGLLSLAVVGVANFQRNLA